MSNDYRKGPLVTSAGGRKVWSFDAYLEECYAVCGERSTRVLDAATSEWTSGRKSVPNVKRSLNGKPQSTTH